MRLVLIALDIIGQVLYNLIKDHSVMKEYYSERFNWIFNYTSKNFFYVLAKTLCLIIGLPIYCVCVALEMVLTFINMLFCWIPILGMVVGVICKSAIYIVDKTFFLCILTDIGKWQQTHKKEVEYDVSDADEAVEMDASTEDSDAADLQNQ